MCVEERELEEDVMIELGMGGGVIVGGGIGKNIEWKGVKEIYIYDHRGGGVFCSSDNAYRSLSVRGSVWHFLYSKEDDVDYLAVAGYDRQKKWTVRPSWCILCNIMRVTITHVSCAQKMHFQITFTQITLIHNVLWATRTVVYQMSIRSMHLRLHCYICLCQYVNDNACDYRHVYQSCVYYTAGVMEPVVDEHMVSTSSTLLLFPCHVAWSYLFWHVC